MKAGIRIVAIATSFAAGALAIGTITAGGVGFATFLIAAPAAIAASPDAEVYKGWLKPGPPPLERFVKPLALTMEQQQKLKPIFAEAQQRAAQEEAEKAKNPGRDAHVQESGLLTREADFRVLLATVLSQDQMSRYESIAATHDANARTLNPHPAHGHESMDKPTPALVEPSDAPPQS
jgi:hypothetical protein